MGRKTVTSTSYLRLIIFGTVSLLLTLSTDTFSTSNGKSPSNGSVILNLENLSQTPALQQSVRRSPRLLTLKPPITIPTFSTQSTVTGLSFPGIKTSSRHRAQKKTPVTTSYLQEVRNAASAFHGRSVNAPLIQAILNKTLPMNAYALFHHSLIPIYQILEAPRDHSNVPGMQQFLNNVHRTLLLKTSGTRMSIHVKRTTFLSLKQNPGLTAYLERLHAIEEDSVLLLAHAFVRYGGDMAGGQTIYNNLLEIYPTEWLQNYTFGTDEEKKALQEEMRGIINEISDWYPDRRE